MKLENNEIFFNVHKKYIQKKKKEDGLEWEMQESKTG